MKRFNIETEAFRKVKQDIAKADDLWCSMRWGETKWFDLPSATVSMIPRIFNYLKERNLKAEICNLAGSISIRPSL